MLNRGQIYHLKYLCDAGAKKEIEVAHFLTWHTHFSSIIAVIRQNRQIHKLLLGLTKFRQICGLRYCMYVSERFKTLRFIFFFLFENQTYERNLEYFVSGCSYFVHNPPPYAYTLMRECYKWKYADFWGSDFTVIFWDGFLGPVYMEVGDPG